MRTITINTTAEDAIAIRQITAMVPLATKHSVGRAALRLGLSQMAGDRKLAVAQLVTQHEARQKGAA